MSTCYTRTWTPPLPPSPLSPTRPQLSLGSRTANDGSCFAAKQCDVVGWTLHTSHKHLYSAPAPLTNKRRSADKMTAIKATTGGERHARMTDFTSTTKWPHCAQHAPFITFLFKNKGEGPWCEEEVSGRLCQNTQWEYLFKQKAWQSRQTQSADTSSWLKWGFLSLYRSFRCDRPALANRSCMCTFGWEEETHWSRSSIETTWTSHHCQ